jgi:hypothetical protein
MVAVLVAVRQRSLVRLRNTSMTVAKVPAEVAPSRSNCCWGSEEVNRPVVEVSLVAPRGGLLRE